MKTCSKCGRELPLSDFARNKTTTDGLQYYCKTCKRDYDRQWRAAHPDKSRASAKKWRDNNIEKVRAKRKRADQKKRNAAEQKRRATKALAKGEHTSDDIGRIYSAQGGCCYYCGAPVGDNYHVDHKTPLSRGGSNSPDNLAVTCPFCNMQKHNKTEAEYRRTRKSSFNTAWNSSDRITSPDDEAPGL